MSEGQEEKKEHEGQSGLEEEGGREEEPFGGAVQMTKDKCGTGAASEKDVDPAVKIKPREEDGGARGR